MKSDITKDLAYYLTLPYTTVLRRDENGNVIARVEEVPGCISHGRDEAEALNNLADMKKLWFEDCLESGETIPEPELQHASFSGRWVQRVPRSLHRRLAEQAKAEGVSLNQLVTSMLSQALSHQVATFTVKNAMEDLERMLAVAIHVPVQRKAEHYWDNSACILSGMWRVNAEPTNSITGLQHVGKLMPRKLAARIENVGNYEDYFASYTDYAKR